jgi:amidophosphoribosyltransferase
MTELWRAATGGDVDTGYEDRLREECGVFGVFGHESAAAITALGLHALQHRGQEGSGIVTYDGQQFHQDATWVSSATTSTRSMSSSG